MPKPTSLPVTSTRSVWLTGIGFAPSFRFGSPFFLAPNVDETVKRFQIKDNLTLVRGRHTFKTGGEWLHTNNAQVFRGFFQEGMFVETRAPRRDESCAPVAPRRAR